MTGFDFERLIEANKASADCLFALANEAFDGFRSLLELQMQTARSALAESEKNGKELLSMYDKAPETFISWQTGLLQPSSVKTLAYVRHLSHIAATIQANSVKVVQAHIDAQQKGSPIAVRYAGQSAPAGRGAAASIVDFVNNACESMWNATTQALELTKGSFVATVAGAT